MALPLPRARARARARARLSSLALALTLLPTACASLYPASIDGLAEPDSLTVYALAPNVTDATDDVGDRVQGIPVRKKVEVKDRDARRHIVTELTRAMNEPTDARDCWKPHYAVRAREGRRSFELLLSFECSSMSVAGEASNRTISSRAQLAIMSALAEN